MRTVYKYPINIEDNQTIDMPTTNRVVHVARDGNGRPCIWAEVDDMTDSAPFKVSVRGTGHPLPKDENHIGTFVDMPFVWHVYSPTLCR